jgi:hypothetical protein
VAGKQSPDPSSHNDDPLADAHCPHCGYSLRGLPENRCPECGKPFGPHELLAEAADGPKPISPRAALLHLLWPPATCLASLFPGMHNSFIVLFLILSLLGMATTLIVAERIVAGRVAERGVGYSKTRDWLPVLLLWLALYAAQLVVAAIPFVVQVTFD